MNQKLDPEKARSYALRLLKTRIRSERELIERMERKGYSKDVSEKTASDLKKAGLLNDQRFAKLFALDEIELKCKGPRYIKYKLKMFGVNDDLISQALDEVMEEVDLKEVFARFVRSRSAKSRDKIVEGLIRRGFDSHTVHETLLEIFDDWRCDDESRNNAHTDIRSRGHTRSNNGLSDGQDKRT